MLTADHFSEFEYGSLKSHAVVVNTSELIEVSNKKKRFVALNKQGMVYPVFVDLVSHKTGTIVRFTADSEAAVRNEFWDGLLREYRTDDKTLRGYTLTLLADESFA